MAQTSNTLAPDTHPFDRSSEVEHFITLFLCGDVMTGRGIDQALPHPSNPILYEHYVNDARIYVKLAERANGAFQKPVSYAYIWGDALDELERVSPDLRIVNLETSVTTSEDYWINKGINYRMHPKNIDCIRVAQIDLCALANNHVLDWGYGGLIETLETLNKAKVKYAGAGQNREEAAAPAVLEAKGKGRVIVLSFGLPTSGIPLSWAAAGSKPGVNVLNDLSEEAVRSVRARVTGLKKPSDILVASIHWGANWGYTIPHRHIDFAHGLVDRAEVDIVYGHSSHHAKAIEVYRGKPIFYGCGDLLNDYEGISGHEEFRSDLGLMYFVSMDPLTKELVRLRMTPTRMKNFRVNRASNTEAFWLRETLSREGALFGTRADLNRDNTLTLRWD